MPEIDYLPFCTAGGNNADSQGDYAGSGYQQTGFQVGVANPAQANKVWRQSSMMAAALANMISTALGGVDVIDDGNLNGLATSLTNAIKALAAGTAVPYTLPIAQPGTLGGVKPDNTTLVVDPTSGVASSRVAAASKGSFTVPGGSLGGGGGQTAYNTGITVPAGSAVALSISSGTPSPILVRDVSVAGGTISLITSNTSSSTIPYGSLTYNYAIL